MCDVITMASYGETYRNIDAPLPPQEPATSYGRSTSLSPYNIDPRYLPATPEFIFPVEKQTRTYSAKLFDAVGSSYLSGLVVGSTWGLYEGVRRPDGKTLRLRMNGVLNGVTRRGPFTGNSLGVLALLYTSWEHTLCKVTKKEDSIVNKVTAASLTGVTFKCTAGVRLMATGGVLGAALSGLYFTASYLLKGSRGKTFYATY